jgi:hypothetical protein
VIPIAVTQPNHQLRIVGVTALIENPGAMLDWVELQVNRTGQNPLIIAGASIPSGAAIMQSWYGGGSVRETGVGDANSAQPLPVMWFDDDIQFAIALRSGAPFNMTEGCFVYEARPKFSASRKKRIDDGA